MGRLVFIMGKSASGKDSIFRELLSRRELGLSRVVPYTTRPVRDGEENGREYFFVDEDTFRQMRFRGQVIESRTYQTVYGPWRYFTADDGQINLERGSSILIGTLESYLSVRDYFGADNIVPVYVEVEDGLRLQRALDRERRQNVPRYSELCRRYLADEKDFSEEKLKEAGIVRRYDNKDLRQCCDTIAGDIRIEERRG